MTTPVALKNLRKQNLNSTLDDILVHLREVADNNKVIMAIASQTNDNGLVLDFQLPPADSVANKVIAGSQAVLDRAVAKKIARKKIVNDEEIDSYEFLMHYYINHKNQSTIVIGEISFVALLASMGESSDTEIAAGLTDDSTKLNDLYNLDDDVSNLMEAIDGYAKSC